MNEITSITPQVKDKKRCNIYIDGRFYCGLTLEAAVKNKLKAGMIVTPEKLNEIQFESEKNTAFDKALNFLSATRKTEAQVRKYLQGKGYLPAVVDHVVEKLSGYDFLNDGEYAKDYVGFASSKKGERLIRMELKAKGVSDEEIDEAMSTVDQKDQEAAATAILQKYMKHRTADKETLLKGFRYLMGKGFDHETSKAALTRFGEIDEE